MARRRTSAAAHERAAPTAPGRLLAWALAAIAVACLAWLIVWWLRPAAQPGGPIVLVSIDTLRADRLPLYGYSAGSTPAIDVFARDAVTFDRAYAHSPQTLPSHVSLLTGQLPFEHGARDNIGFAVPADTVMLQHHLKERGYLTAGFVSSYVLRAEVGIASGFDHYDSDLPPASPQASIAQVQRDGLETLAATETWLAQQTSPRFFLFFHIYEPHTPYAPPARHAKPDPYDGDVSYADEIVGRLFRELRDRALYDRATIVLLSDHGEGLGDHGELEHGVFVYDETIRVPLVVKLPGAPHRGARVPQPVQLIDVLPTVLDLVGTAAPAGLRGRSLRPLLDDPAARIAEQGIYAEALYPRYHFGWSELLALTDTRFRFIRAPRPELYDLQTDPGERHNLVDERSQTATAMRNALDALVAGRAIDRPAAVSREAIEQFQALGYVSMQAGVAPEVPGESLPDPKDKIPVLEMYRRAVDLAGAREFDHAINLLEQIVADNPAMVDVWQQLGNLQMRAGRYEDSLASYRCLVELRASDPVPLVAVAASLLKLRRLDEARANAELAVKTASNGDRRALASAHELLVKIALARRDREAARRHAALAQAADPSLPMSTYVQGLLLHGEERYADALPFFEDARRQLASRTLTLSELHFYLGDTLARLGRHAEAEAELREEVRLSPNHARARASLAMLYRSTGRDAEAARTIDDLLRTVPTPEGYDLAARLWRMFGEAERAAAVEAAARQRFGGRE